MAVTSCWRRKLGVSLLVLAGASGSPHARAAEPAVAKSNAPSAAHGQTTARASFEGSAYHDTDHVNVVTPTVAGTVADPVAGWSATGSYLVDAVSAASVDIVSSASKHWKEVRHVGAASFHLKPHDFGLDVGGGVSREPDYLAIGFGGTLAWDLFEKNLTVVLGGSYGDETAGRSGTSFAVFSRRLLKTGLRGGATVIVDPATSYDLVVESLFERGDQSKPYRYVPLFAPGTGANVARGASVDDVNAARLSTRAAERLPPARNRYALTNRLAHRFAGSALHLEERLYVDSWGMKASTTDGRWVIDAGRSAVVWPHLRMHLQGPVTFWQRAYEVQMGPGGAMSVPEIRTGDRELGPVRSWTLGGGSRLRVARAWALTFQGDAVVTTYSDALFITGRMAFFGALGIEVELE